MLFRCYLFILKDDAVGQKKEGRWLYASHDLVVASAVVSTM